MTLKKTTPISVTLENGLKFHNETKGVCCNSGKAVTEAFPELHRFLQDLISEYTERSTVYAFKITFANIMKASA